MLHTYYNKLCSGFILFVRVCIHAHVYVHIRMQWSEDSLGDCSSGTHPLLFVRQALSLAWDLPVSLGWLTGSRDLLASTLPAWGS